MNPAISDQPFVFQSPTAPTDGKGTARPDSGDVGQTQREISEIVREVAAVSRTKLSVNRYFGILVDRILRAMAAEGVVIWERSDSEVFHPIRRIGTHTDLHVPEESRQAHARMLREVCDDDQPVVVPSTPGATDPDTPANPTPFPCAIVPIELMSSDKVASSGGDVPVYLIQVFLEPGGGVAAQRGYLRFVAQMADLAGEFLRNDRMRVLQQNQAWIQNVDRWVAEIQQLSNPQSVMERVSDQIAEAFGFARVAWLRQQDSDNRKPPKVIAVSHVDEIDAQSEAVRWLATCVQEQVSRNGTDDDSHWKLEPDEASEGRDPISVEALEQSQNEPSNELQLEAVLPVPKLSDDGPVDHLVLLSASDAAVCDARLRIHVERFVDAVGLTLDQIERIHALQSGGRFRFGARIGARPFQWSWKWAVLTTMVVGVCCFPIPITVTAPATLRPSGVQRVCAPRQAVVRDVLVEHGDRVRAGQPLIKLEDTALNEQIASLLSRRAVLIEKRTAWTKALVGSNTWGQPTGNGKDDPQDADSQRQLIEAELQGVESELSLLQAAQESLLILADREGIVDAWQLRDRLRDRPVSRGESLLNVVDEASTWYADAKVPQTRIQQILDAQQRGEDETIVYPLSDPSLRVVASVDQVGPAVVNLQGSPQTLVRLTLGQPGSNRDDLERRSQSFHEGAPLKVFVRSGRAPIGYLLFQDAIEWLRVRIGLYSSRLGRTS